MSNEIRLPPKWIELNVQKRECITFIQGEDERNCQCGKPKTDHSVAVVNSRVRGGDFWIPSANTQLYPTDAHGTLVFEGEHYPNKAHYVRLSHDTNPEVVVQMMTLVWGLQMPKFVISVRGGNNNFEIPSRIGKILQLGLIKAAKSTGAWIISNGLNRGVAKHVGSALGNQRLLGVTRGRVVSIGIAPWGMVENKEALVGRNKERVYNPLQHPASKYIILNPRHANFLLVDNGSTGKFGGESAFRRRFEKCISSYPTSPHRGCDTPVVCVVVEGGFNVLRTVAEYLHDDPPTPVVIFSGTGRAADLITLVFKRINSGMDIEQTKDEACAWMVKLFSITATQAVVLFSEIRRIVCRRNLVTMFSPKRSSDGESFDRVLLASIFRSQHWTPLQQLSLALVWDRVDIATNEVFVYGRDWSREHLEHAMFESLVADRLNFVSLLIEHGLNVQTFLTAARLESLYHADHHSSWVMKTLLFEIAKIRTPHHKKVDGKLVQDRNMTLHDVGFVMSHMMGSSFKSRYYHIKIQTTESDDYTAFNLGKNTFPQPFDDLFIWAVLTKRHKTALLLWRHGTGALAKSLVAVKLNKYLADELTSTEKTETNMAAEFQAYATEWESLSLDLLDMSFKADAKMARQLLTMELESFSSQTCLTLAVMANHRMLLGHPCCQILLADLWMGALNITRNSTFKIMIGIIVIPATLFYDYKTTEELKLLPHQGHLSPSKHDIMDQASLLTLAKSRISMLSTTGDGGRDLRAISRAKSYTRPPQANRPHPAHPTHPTHPTTTHGPTHTVPLTAKEASDMKMSSAEDVQKRPGPAHHRVNIDEHASSDSEGGDINVAVDDIREGKFSWRSGGVTRDASSGQDSFVTTRQDLSMCRKVYEFQKAPVVNFYRHMLGYLVFLSTLAYVILVPQDRGKFGFVEMYVIAYLATLACEALREFICIDAYSWAQKWSVFRTKSWVIADASIVSFFMIGVTLRCQATTEPAFFNYGFLIYKVSSIYWNLRLYKYMSVHRFVGPKIVMMSRMLKHMAYFAMIILVVLIAFGISRESIRFPDTSPTWKNIAEAFLEPYIMFYGEIDIDSLSPQCGEEGEPECPVGHWIIPLTWTIYMMVANILIVNVLIAVFNGIYSEVDAIAVELWMFQRFTFVMEFEQKPLLPPPFISICHTYYIFRWMYQKCIGCLCDNESEEELLDFEELRNVITGNDHSLKTFLSPAEVNRAFDFEEEHVDNISLGTTPYEDGMNALRKSMYPGSSSSMDPGLNTGNVQRGRAGPTGNFHFEFLEMENKGMTELQGRITDLFSEMESQRSKIDKLISLIEDDQDEFLQEDG